MVQDCATANSTSECYLHYVTSENQLFSCLSSNSSYSPFVFPLMGHILSSNKLDRNATLEMGIAILIHKLLALTNDKKLSVVIDLTLSWLDPNIKCSLVHNVTEVLIPSSAVWTPELKLLNPATSNISYPVYPLVKIYPRQEGSWVKAYVTANFEAVCSTMNFVEFPFDSETCSIILTVFNGRNRISFDPHRETFAIATGASSSEWALQAVDVQPCVTNIQGHDYKAFNITLDLRRESFYYILHLLIPITVSESLVALVLIMPTDQGSKVKLGAMIMLNVYVLQNSVVAVLPQIKRHEVPNIVIALYAGFLISVASLAESVFFHTVHIIVPGLPSWMNNFVQWLFVSLWRRKSQCEESTKAEQQQLCSDSDNNDDTCPAASFASGNSHADGTMSTWMLERILNCLQDIAEQSKKRDVLRQIEAKQAVALQRKRDSRKLVMVAWKRFEYTSSFILLIVHIAYMVYFFGYFMYR